ncbi:aprataxin and PNK-like factor isoform X2 [Erinaceus europaeus]|uniref:Aprataxin and PNK-like factor isoform X2 n=1 Tax=Erinaceus europaeus TaxID=9365 RepID=A0ABM3X2W6_ERIEU|nr:aprataxin and PNK-like factor isoform X2 [Erinaceus europaeus]
MSGAFELQPLDGGPRLALAPGETVIGRGPLLGITDKKVSRRHAILEVVGGQLRIKPIHTNPCFYQSSEKSQLLPLRTDLWHWLKPGDSFSLSPDKYIFRVYSTHPEVELECTLRNSQMFDEDSTLNETPVSSLMNLPDVVTGTSQLERRLAMTKTQTSTPNCVFSLGECREFSKQQSNPTQRKRILPAWMLTENSSGQTYSASIISGDNNVIQGSGKEATYKDTPPPGNITLQGKKRLISARSSESIPAEQDPGKKCRNADQGESIISSKEVSQCSTINNTEVNNVKIDPQRNIIPVEELGEVSEQKATTQHKENNATNYLESSLCTPGRLFSESQGSHPESSSDPSNPATLCAKATDSDLQVSEENKVKRTSCMYGANCYRKNPVHFQHFSHPGDSDYGSEQAMCQDEADERPLCPYGASCYRIHSTR